MEHITQFLRAVVRLQSFKQQSLTALLLLVTLSASAYDFEVDGFYYNKLSDETVAVTFNQQWSATDTYTGDITIPSSVTTDGTTYTVTEIGEYAFYACDGLTSVTIPNTITKIGTYAFYHCI